MEKRKTQNVKEQPEPRGAYQFCGEGLGIPGLPHEVTMELAKELGMLDVLQAALLNRNYKAKGE